MGDPDDDECGLAQDIGTIIWGILRALFAVAKGIIGSTLGWIGFSISKSNEGITLMNFKPASMVYWDTLALAILGIIFTTGASVIKMHEDNSGDWGKATVLLLYGLGFIFSFSAALMTAIPNQNNMTPWNKVKSVSACLIANAISIILMISYSVDVISDAQ